MERKASDLKITQQPLRGVLGYRLRALVLGWGILFVCLHNPGILCRIQACRFLVFLQKLSPKD